MSQVISESGVVYGRITTWKRELERKGLTPKWVIERVLFKVKITEPIKIGKLAYSQKPVYTLLGDYEFVRTYHIRIPFKKTET